MSNAIPPRPRLATSIKRQFAIVASQYNAPYVQGLIDHATAELQLLAANSRISLQQVPGAFEIPIVVQELAAQKKADIIIAVGVILQGQTRHAEHLGRTVTEALQRIALDHGVPIINAVLNLDSEEQAQARCLDHELNRGTEAARAAVQIAAVMSDLRGA
jgi:6,7-dimethyl-8-ribityllumazine synthase